MKFNTWPKGVSNDLFEINAKKVKAKAFYDNIFQAALILFVKISVTN